MSKKNTKIKKIIKRARETARNQQSVQNPSAQPPQFNIPNSDYIEGIGRRKVATARVRIYEGEGDFVVNNQLMSKYFANIPQAHVYYNRPFELTKTKGKFAVTVQVKGSGVRAQLDAVVHGLARALVKYDPEFRSFLKSAGLLTRDDRMKETRKVGRGGKARRKRQSPKR